MTILTFDDDAPLQCPNCESSYLHQRQVIIRERQYEDKDGLLVHVTQGTVGIGPLRPTDFRGRRQELSVVFFCENCEDPGLVLVIQQHKGQTLRVRRKAPEGDHHMTADRQAHRPLRPGRHPRQLPLGHLAMCQDCAPDTAESSHEDPRHEANAEKLKRLFNESVNKANASWHTPVIGEDDNANIEWLSDKEPQP